MIRRIDSPSGPLDDLPDPPAALWVRGTLPFGATVGIVGTRRADDPGRAFARRLGLDLARAGVGVVSGGAEGIDGAAHSGALDGGGRTWVVHPTPLDRPYPSSHRSLFERVVRQGGGCLSERPSGTVVQKAHFLLRNRLIAAFSDAVVVVQAPHKSGALGTAHWAVHLGRPLYAVPASPWDPRGEGCVALLRRGALVCSSSAELVKALERETPSTMPPELHVAERLEPELQRVLDALGAQPLPVDELVRATGLGPIRVRIALVQLAARDLVDQCDAGWLAVA